MFNPKGSVTKIEDALMVGALRIEDGEQSLLIVRNVKDLGDYAVIKPEEWSESLTVVLVMSHPDTFGG